MRGSPSAGLLLLCVVSFACAAGESGSEDEVPVRVGRVGLDVNDLPVMILEEQGGSRWLPIWIGSAEASSIALQIEAVESPRPNTHDLANRLIAGLHGEVERVVVVDLRGGTYYATLTLRAEGRRVQIDSRPSDAVAIALRAGAPIFVRDGLFSQASSGRDAPTGPRRSI